MPFSPQRYRPGDPVRAVDFNAQNNELRRLGRLQGGDGIIVHEGGTRQIALDIDEDIYIQLTTSAGTAGAYGWAAVIHSAPNTWTTTGYTGTQTADPAYERRTGSTALTAGSTVYRARRAPTTRSWVFASRGSTPTPTLCGCICLTITGCGTNPVLYSTITATATGGFSQTCSPSVGVTSINVASNGSGYTSPPTVTISGGGGSGTTATANLGSGSTAGKVISITVTAPGGGYTSTPTVALSGGGGSGATAGCVCTTTVCIQSTASGTYTFTVSAPGFTTKTVNEVVTGCGGATATIALSIDTGYVCCSSICWVPFPDTLYITAPDGVTTALVLGGTTWSPATMIPISATVAANATAPCTPPGVGGTSDYTLTLQCGAGVWTFSVFWNSCNIASGLYLPMYTAGGALQAGGNVSSNYINSATATCDEGTWSVTTTPATDGPGPGIYMPAPMGYGAWTWST